MDLYSYSLILILILTLILTIILTIILTLIHPNTQIVDIHPPSTIHHTYLGLWTPRYAFILSSLHSHSTLVSISISTSTSTTTDYTLHQKHYPLNTIEPPLRSTALQSHLTSPHLIPTLNHHSKILSAS